MTTMQRWRHALTSGAGAALAFVAVMVFAFSCEDRGRVPLPDGYVLISQGDVWTGMSDDATQYWIWGSVGGRFEDVPAALEEAGWEFFPLAPSGGIGATDGNVCLSYDELADGVKSVFVSETLAAIVDQHGELPRLHGYSSVLLVERFPCA